MTKTNLSMFCLIMLIGIGGAFADAKKARAASFYYGVWTTSGVKWQLTAPSGKSCSTSSSFACLISSSEPQSTVLALTNSFPATYTIISGNAFIYN